ncbi:MAG TPA: NUDIX domain-containing protein [Terriglobales bacterium]|nr:NUDIX domain-containing protein [Terriglobales bacterium]
MIATKLKRKMFWMFSRAGMAAYSRFPVFGVLNASLGVIKKNDAFLVIERNDGRGVSFPGGLAFPWETAEQAAVREIEEETGLKVTKSILKSRYYSSAELPVQVTVFETEADGQLRDSWEGSPSWLRLDELRPRIIPSQRCIAETL